MAWLVHWLGPRRAQALEYLLAMLVVIVVASAGYLHGWQVRDKQARLDVATSAVANLQQLLTLNDYSSRVAGDYVLRRGAADIRFIALRSEVPHVVSFFVPLPGAAQEPLPRCVFTAGFERVWNAALEADADLPAADDRFGAPAGSAAAQTAEADLYDSGLSQADILGNHVDNAAIDALVRLQCSGLLKVARHIAHPEE